MRLNQIRSNGDIVMRCPNCGDSKNINSGHLMVNLITGEFYCHRCSYSGKVPHSIFLELLERTGFSLEDNQIIEREIVSPTEVKPGAGLPRSSNLDRYHILFKDKLWDVFKMRYPGGSVSGIYMRTQDKISYVYGEKSLGFTGEGPLVSDDNHPIRLVEGPYDVTDERDVCVFGLISYQVLLRYFVGQSVILMPDGDVWKDSILASQVYKILEYSQQKGISLVGVDFIKDGKDPDEVSEDDIIRIRRKELPSFKETLKKILYRIETKDLEDTKFSNLPLRNPEAIYAW